MHIHIQVLYEVILRHSAVWLRFLETLILQMNSNALQSRFIILIVLEEYVWCHWSRIDIAFYLRKRNMNANESVYWISKFLNERGKGIYITKLASSSLFFEIMNHLPHCIVRCTAALSRWALMLQALATCPHKSHYGA